jgi:hypothetical protein
MVTQIRVYAECSNSIDATASERELQQDKNTGAEDRNLFAQLGQVDSAIITKSKGALWIGSIQPADKVFDGRSPKRFWYSWANRPRCQNP